MSQFSEALLAIDKFSILPQRVIDCAPGLGGINYVYVPDCPTLSI